jgi:hypothetical protein
MTRPPPPPPYAPSPCATPTDRGICGDPVGVHEVKGTGLAKKHGRCTAVFGPTGTPCGCPGYTPGLVPA